MMNFPTRSARMLMLACALALAGCIHTPPVPDMSAALRSPSLDGNGPKSVTVPIIIDDNRVFVEVTFLRPDGSERKALAYVNMGQTPVSLSNELFRELAPGDGHPLRLSFAGMQIVVDGRTVQPQTMLGTIRININPFAAAPTPAQMAKGPGGQSQDFFGPLNVEALIPAGLLEHFEVAFDYGAKTMTLAAPGTLMPEGVAVPLRVNPKTGFAMLDASLDGVSHPFVIDNGGSYTAFRDAGAWVSAHPEWLRSTNGIGEANYVMSPAGIDATLPVLKIPHASFGSLALEDLGGEELDFPGMAGALVKGAFWDMYSEKAGEKVDGWIGGNVLKSFRLTLDYPNRMSYWLAQSPLDTHDLDQVGIVLGRAKGIVTVTAIAQKNGADTVTGVQKGDRLVRIGDLDTATATRGQLLSALHGKPGDVRHLVLDRAGIRIEVDATVTAF